MGEARGKRREERWEEQDRRGLRVRVRKVREVMGIPPGVRVLGGVEAGRCLSSLLRTVSSVESRMAGKVFVRVYD